MGDNDGKGLGGYLTDKEIEDVFQRIDSHSNVNNGSLDGEKVLYPGSNEMWEIVKAYIEEYGLVRAQIESYNYFGDKIVPRLIDSLQPIEVKCDDPFSPHRGEKHTLKFRNGALTKCYLMEQDSRKRVKVDRQTRSVIKDNSPLTETTPKIARDRKQSYSGRLYTECVYTVTTKRNGEEEKSITRIFPTVSFGLVPLMVKSQYCHLADKDENELRRMGEDPTDPGGYFIANGGTYL